MKIALYSCYFGDHERYNPEALGDVMGYDRFLFTDADDLQPQGVEKVIADARGLGPALESRRLKMRPNLHFSSYDWAIYVDNRAVLKMHPEELIARIKSNSPHPGQAVFAFPHPDRNCVYDELDECFKIGHLNEERWRAIRSLYRRLEIKRGTPLTQNTILIYNMRSPDVAVFGQAWFELFLTYPRRDQLTMCAAEVLSGHEARRLDFQVTDIADWPVIADASRKRPRYPSIYDCVKRPLFGTLFSPRYRTYHKRREQYRKLIKAARREDGV